MGEDQHEGRGPGPASRIRAVRRTLTRAGLIPLMRILSRTFSNAVGGMRVGGPVIRGRRRASVRRDLRGVLRPGDVLLDKTRYLLTDRFIPGHFGHAALWLGSPEDLRAEDLWGLVREQPANGVDHVAKLERGHGVLEALRNGVQLNPLDQFLRVDEVAALRWKNGAHVERARVLQHALGHVGRSYDYEFDLQAPRGIICSELILRSFPADIPWPTHEQFERLTIEPDGIAARAGPHEGLPFDVLYYNDGHDAHHGPAAWAPYWRALDAAGGIPGPHAAPPLRDAMREMSAAARS